MTRPIRLLVADDSPIFVDVLREALAADPAFEIVGVAADGRQAAEQAQALRPDVITMDVRMPVMDGLEAVSRIMSEAPTPILVLTAEQRGAADQLTFEALSRGALDLSTKPDGLPSQSDGWATLRAKLKLLAGVPVIRHVGHRRPAERPSQSSGETLAARARVRPQVVALVASTGGPAALGRILGALPGDFPTPVLVVQHLAPGFLPGLASWLDSLCKVAVQVARAPQRALPSTVYLAPDHAHLVLGTGGQLELQPQPSAPGEPQCPSGNVLLRSVAHSAGRAAVGVVLTGMGDDGAAGLQAIHVARGVTVAQDAASAVVDGMPRAARLGCTVEHIGGLDDISALLCRLTESPRS